MSEFRNATCSALNDLMAVPEADLAALAKACLSNDALWDVAFPVERLEGADNIVEGLILPLRHALTSVKRRDEIFIGGPNRRGPGQWVASVTHYVGNFDQPLFGIEPSGHLAFLRAGEFYRIDKGRIAEGKLIIDFLDLLRQAGRFPLPNLLGTEMLFPGPATHDGVLPNDDSQGEQSLDLVEAMLADLHVFDPESMDSEGQTGEGGYWHDDLLWYGPAGIGSSYRWSGFVKDHRQSFLDAFPDRKGGNHYCRIGNGDYAAVSGWPSMTMTHQGDYLGVGATGKALTLRVMDFYRCADNKIMENWVLLDYLDLFNQMGVDLLRRASDMFAR